MSTVIDNRVVEMRFDNEQFEKGVNQSIGTLEKLKQSLNFSNTDFASKLNFGVISEAVTTVSEKFTAFEAIAIGALMRIGAQAVDVGEKFVKSFTIDQLSAGWQKYEDKTTAVQTIMAATASQFTDTGDQMAYVNEQLDKLNWFTDETSYNFVDMVSNIGKFTSNGIKLDDAVTSMQGIATWAAISGQNANTASRAMYNLAQAIGTGSVKLIDWRSIETANMATVEFKQNVLDAAVNIGTLTKSADGLYKTAKGTAVSIQDFGSALTEGWFSKDVLQQVLDKYGAATDKLYQLSETSDISATNLLRLVKAQKEGTLTTEQLASSLGDSDMSVQALRKGIEELASQEYDLGIRSLQAAQEAKTFTEAIEATKEAVSTGWMKSFELMFGDYEKAKVLWTDMSNVLWDIFASGGEARNELLADWGNSNWESLAESIKHAGISIGTFEEQVRFALESHGVDVDALIAKYGSLGAAIEQGGIKARNLGVAVQEAINEILNSPGASLGSAEDKLKEIQEIVTKIWAGELGNGEERKKALENLGYNYDDIQKLVNKGQDYAIQLKDYSEELANVEAQLKELGKGGGVDLTKRPIIDASVLKDAGWEEAAEGAATVFSSTFSNEAGDIAANFTPIIVDEHGNFKGVLSPEELTKYAEEVISGVREDDLHLQIGANFEGEDAISKAEEVAQKIHELQESYYLGNSEQREMLEALLGDYERLANLTGESGRAMLAEGIINALTALSDIIVLVREEWEKFFGSLDSGTLKDITEKFRDLTRVLRLYNDDQTELTETGEKVKAVLDKIFTVGQNVFNVFQQLARIFGDLVSSLAPVREAVANLAGSLLDLFGTVAGRFGKFLETVDLTQEFGSVSSAAAEAINFLAGKVDELRVKFETWKPGDVLKSIGEKLQEVSGVVGDFFKTTEDGVGPLEKIAGYFESLKEKMGGVKGVVEALTTPFKNLWETIKKLLDLEGVNNVFEAFVRITNNIIKTISDSIHAIFENVKLEDVLKLIKSIGQALLTWNVAKSFRIGNWIGEEIWSSLNNVSEILNKIREKGLGSLFSGGNPFGEYFDHDIEWWIKDVKVLAESLLMVGGALLMVAAALAIVSAIDPGDLVRSLETLGLAIAGLMALMLGFGAAMQMLEINPASMIAGAAAILVMAVALIVLAGALAAFALVAKMDTVWQGFEYMAGTLTLVAVALALLAEYCNAGKLLAAAASILVVSAALVVLAAALGAFSAIAMMSSVWDGFILMAGSLAAVSVALAVLANSCNPVELAAAAAAILVVSAALVVMAVALAGFTLIANQGIAAAAGLLALVAVLAALTAALVILSALGPQILIGAAALVAGAVAVVAIAAGLAAAAAAVAALGIAIGAAILAVGVGVGGALAAVALGISTALIAISAGVTAVVAAISASIALLGAGLSSAVSSIGTGIGTAIAGMGTGIGLALEAIGTGIGQGFENIGKGIADGISKISEAVGGIGDSIASVGTGIESFGASVKTLGLIDLIGIGAGLIEFAKGVKEINKNKFTADSAGVEAYANAFQKLSQASSQIAPIAETLKSTMSTLGTEMTSNLANGIQNGMAGVSAAATTIVNNLNVSLNGAVTDASRSGTSVGTEFVRGVTSGISSASAAGRNLAQAAYTAVSGYTSQFRTIGYNFSSGLASGISSGSGIVSSAARSVVNAAVSAARSAAQVRSPSRVFAKIGSFLSLGMAKGIESETGSVEDATQEMLNSAIDGVGRAMAAVSDRLSQGIEDEIVIAPVVDMSNIETSSKRINDLLSNNDYTYKAAGTIAAQHTINQDAAQKQETVVATMDPAMLASLVNATRQSGSPKVEVNFGGSLAQLGAVLQPVIVSETNRLGNSLINA